MNRPNLIQSWRRFSFFDRDRVRDAENPDNPFLGFQDLRIQCIANGKNGTVFFGEIDGSIHHIINNKDWESNYFRAYKTAMYQMIFFVEKNLLVTIGEDGPGVNPFLKIWTMDKIDKNGVPFCSRCSKTGPGSRAIKVTALAVASNLVAVGFEDSTLLLFRGDILKEKQNKSQLIRDGLTSSEDGTINALALQQNQNDKTAQIMYVGTPHVIVVYNIGQREKDVKQIAFYREPCTVHCWALADSQLMNQFVVARREGVYFYDADSKGGVQLFEGEKFLIKTVANYLLIVFRDINTIELEQKEKMNLLTIYDLTNTYIAYSAPIPQVVEIFFAFGSFYAITKSGQLFELIEKDNKAKLEILFRKNLYDLAVKLAETCYFADDSLVDIYMQYGDFLFAKNDYQNAVKQYIKTIGKVEPSAIIKKFLDSQRIEQMTEYLEALHKTEYATNDHRTILLNCYTKMSDSAKIDKFVKSTTSQPEFDPSIGSGYLDIETGVRVLKESGYIQQALALAKKHKLWDLYLSMLIEDVQDYDAAISCLHSMNFEPAKNNAKKYGKILVNAEPYKMLELIQELCQGFKKNAEDHCDPEDFIDLMTTQNELLIKFLESLIELPERSYSTNIYHTLLELYLKSFASEALDQKEKILTFMKDYYNRLEFDKILILCRSHDFEPGIVFLYEKSQMTKQLLQHYIQKENFEKVFETCKKYGSEKDNKEMWIDALWFFSRSPNTPDHLVQNLLKSADLQQLLPPLMVLEVLSHSPKITLGVVKDYLLDWLKDENNSLEKYEQQIGYYKQEIEKNQSIIQDIERNPQVFQVSKCSACDAPLETPTVHFLCKHSFHQHCFESYSDNDSECPACSSENKKIRASSIHQEHSRDVYQQFKNDLAKSEDAISTLADYISKGAFHMGSKMSGAVSGGRKKSDVSAASSKDAISTTKFEKSIVAPQSTNPFELANPFGDDEED